MRKALFVIFHGFDPNNGISKKITYQVDALKACGLEVHLCYMDESSGKKRLIDGRIIADYGDGIISKIRKRVELSCINQYAKENYRRIICMLPIDQSELFDKARGDEPISSYMIKLFRADARKKGLIK